jgi:hypothetical protein
VTSAEDISYPKLSRGPWLSAHRRAYCGICKRYVSPWSDLDDAKRAGAQHSSQHAHAVVAAEVETS